MVQFMFVTLNMFLYGGTGENRTLVNRLKAGYSTIELQSRCFVTLRRALLLLRCDPAFRNNAKRTKQLRSLAIGFDFILRSL